MRDSTWIKVKRRRVDGLSSIGTIRQRKAIAGLRLVKNFRVLINRRKYIRFRRGIVRLQAQIRGGTVRKVNAARMISSYRIMLAIDGMTSRGLVRPIPAWYWRGIVRLQAQFRGRIVRKALTAYRKIISATIALQCCARRALAKKVFDKAKAKPSASNQSPHQQKTRSPSKHAVVLSPSSKENMNNGKNYTKPKSPIKKVRSSPPPTNEIYTKAQAKAVEDVLLASNNGTASPYAVLNLQPNASDTDIKRRYRKLALKVHPDKNPAPLAGKAFQVIGNAYDVLKSPTKKAAYDTSNSVHRSPQEQPAAYSTHLVINLVTVAFKALLSIAFRVLKYLVMITVAFNFKVLSVVFSGLKYLVMMLVAAALKAVGLYCEALVGMQHDAKEHGLLSSSDRV